VREREWADIGITSDGRMDGALSPKHWRTSSVEMNLKPAQSILDRFQGWTLLGTAMISFVAGSLFTARLGHLREVSAESDRVFELMIYHAMPGKVSGLEKIFSEVAKLQTKHNLHVIGYWVPNEDPGWKDTFIYLVAHPSRDAATRNWKALHSDPAFPPYRRAAIPLIQSEGDKFKVDEIYMRPTDYSELK
jgi:NIPSNAP